MYTSHNTIQQLSMGAPEAAEKAKEKMIPVLEISMDRIAAIYEMAKRYCKGESFFSIPNGNFSDAEVELWELFIKAFKNKGDNT